MLSKTWKTILHLSVIQAVKELKFNDLKSIGSLNRKKYLILNLQKRLQTCALLAFSDCICCDINWKERLVYMYIRKISFFL